MELPRPSLRGVTHRWAFFIALGAGATLVAAAPAGAALAATAIYAATLAALYGISATYHNPGKPAPRLAWQRLDHAMIFVFIAGSYTPVAVLAIGGAAGGQLLAIVWGGAAIGVGLAVAWPGAPRAVNAALYVALGWALVAYWPDVRAALAPAPLALMAIGGALYTLGAVVYAARRPDPLPTVFGYHEVFHALVIAASVCHFAMTLLIVRGR